MGRIVARGELGDHVGLVRQPEQARVVAPPDDVVGSAHDDVVGSADVGDLDAGREA